MLFKILLLILILLCLRYSIWTAGQTLLLLLLLQVGPEVKESVQVLSLEHLESGVEVQLLVCTGALASRNGRGRRCCRSCSCHSALAMADAAVAAVPLLLLLTAAMAPVGIDIGLGLPGMK